MQPIVVPALTAFAALTVTAVASAHAILWPPIARAKVLYEAVREIRDRRLWAVKTTAASAGSLRYPLGEGLVDFEGCRVSLR